MEGTVRSRPIISDEERARRKNEVDFARRSVRYEGTVLRPEIEKINEKYINGLLTSEEHGEAVRASTRKFVDGYAHGFQVRQELESLLGS